jgi:spermidine synthase
MTNKNAERSPVTLILLLFFVSGALALVYQVVWARMMMHVFGSTAIAVGTVFAAFMSGMAIGAWLIGKIADKSPDCLRLYAWLEIGIALAALVSHILLSRISPAHLAIYEFLGSSAVVFAFVRFLLAFLLVMGPTVLMGATLPVLSQLFVSRHFTKVGITLSTLYATNTFGAVIGVLLTGFFLIGSYGIHVPVYIAVAGNLVIGCVAWIASRRWPDGLTRQLRSPEQQAGRGSADSLVSSRTFHVILIGLGISGFTSFAYEIYWTRSLVFILGNSTYALTTMLSAFLTGIALGGYLIRFLLGPIKDRAVIFGCIQVFLGVFSALALPLLFSIGDIRSLSQYLIGTSSEALPLIFSGFGLAFLVMLVPATLIGTTIPLVGQIGVRNLRETGSSVGKIYAVNTLGNVLGSLLPGFILLNWLGIQRGILAMAVLNVTVGFTILFFRLARSPRNPVSGLALTVALTITVIILSRTPLQFQFPSAGEFDSHQTLFYREGPLATTKVFWNPRSTEKYMSIDGIVIGGTGTVEFKQLLLAHLPKLLLQDVSKELSVGLGSGIMLGESLLHSSVHKITGVEIEPSVIEGASFFAKENHQVLKDQKLTIVNDDIVNFLRTTADSYQVISADEKTADEYASNGFSYSLEYYDLLRDRLAPGGLVAQWVPTTLPPTQFQMILKTFSRSFPHVQLWYFLPAHKRGTSNSILIGSKQRIPVSYHYIDQQLAENPQAYRSLVRYGLTSAEAVLPHYVADEQFIRGAVGTAVINSVEYPRYEFFYPWDYAAEKEKKNLSNHQFILALKRQAYPSFLASLEKEGQIGAKLKQTFTAEDSYLVGFEKFLTGLPSAEVYLIFDHTLSLAPWNDSLRARIFTIYSYLASTSRDVVERARRMRRANALLDKNQIQ